MKLTLLSEDEFDDLAGDEPVSQGEDNFNSCAVCGRGCGEEDVMCAAIDGDRNFTCSNTICRECSSIDTLARWSSGAAIVAGWLIDPDCVSDAYKKNKAFEPYALCPKCLALHTLENVK